MSLIPMLHRDWWATDDDFFRRPHRLLDQHFGLGMHHDDLWNSLCPAIRRSTGYMRPWCSNDLMRHDMGSTVQQKKDKYEMILDVQQFSPNEITVKVNKDTKCITVEGKHEEKQDEHGYVSRHFLRRYVLPKDNDIDAVQSSLSSDGVLTVTAPRIQQAIESGSSADRSIPITHTGPSKNVASSDAAAKK